jgi:transposase-like protein
VKFNLSAFNQNFSRDLLLTQTSHIMETALKAEVEHFIATHDQKLAKGSLGRDGCPNRLVHNGYLPERRVNTPLGLLTMNIPRLRDRGQGDKIRYVSRFVPPYGRNMSFLGAPLAWLYLTGLMTGDFQPTLSYFWRFFLPPIARAVRWRLKNYWLEDFEDFWGLSLKPMDFSFYWAQAIQTHKRKQNKALLVLIGVKERGHQTFLGLTEGSPQASADWAKLFRRLKERGLDSPRPVVGAPDLGVWAGLMESFGIDNGDFPRGLDTRLEAILAVLPPDSQAEAEPILRNISRSGDFVSAMTGALKLADRLGNLFPSIVSGLYGLNGA